LNLRSSFSLSSTCCLLPFSINLQPSHFPDH
jgi:hypothetical protein